MLIAFSHIITHVLAPVFLMTGAGFFLQRRFGCDVNSFAKINLYFFIPAFMFVKVAQSELTITQMGKIGGFVGAFITLLWVWSQVVAWFRGYSKARRNSLSMTQMFYNSGNFGLPINELAFPGNPFAQAVQITVMTAQNLLCLTLGLWVLAHGKISWRQSWKVVLRYPFLYVLGLALLVRYMGWSIWPPIWTGLEHFSKGLIPVAMVTLGAQLAQVRMDGIPVDVLLACAGRLILAPLLGLGLLVALGWEGLLQKVLLLSCGAPTAINVAILTIEFQVDPNFASKVTFLSTLLSSISVTLLLMWMR